MHLVTNQTNLSETANRLKRGAVRDDNLVFLCYRKSCKNGEYWITPDKFIEYNNRQKESGKAWRKKNPEKSKECCKASYKKHRQKKLDYHRNRRAKNPELYQSRQNAYRQANSEVIKLKNNERRKKDPEKYRKRIREYHKTHPEKRCALQAKRRAKTEKNLCNLSKDEKKIIESLYEYRRRVSDCIGIEHHVDHIVPLSRGGLHALENLRVIPASLNLRKHNKLPHEIAQAA